MDSSRPAWGCLDAREMQEAASGHAVDSAVREHLTGCKDCRRAVRELRAVVGQSTGFHDGRYRRPLLARPAFWVLLVILGGLGYGFWRWDRTKPPPPAPAQPTAEAQPVAAPPPRPKVRRLRPPRPASRPADDSGNNAAATADVIRKNQTGVRMCYERALKREPGLSLRRLDVRLNISAGGLVDRVSLADLPGRALLSNCIRNTIRAWKFPPGNADYETEFSLHLQPGH